MNLYYIKSIVKINVQGISGPFEQTVAWLVNAENLTQAKKKYEDKVGIDYKHMQYRSIQYEYIEATGEIK